MKLKILFFSLAISAMPVAIYPQAPLQTANPGTIERHYIYSPQMKDTVTIDVWLPQDYDSEKAGGYPTIYMHDGQNLFDASTTWNRQSWEMDSVISALSEGKRITPPVVIGIHSRSETRLGDLLPRKALLEIGGLMDSLAEKSPEEKLRGDQYAEFVAITLKHAMDSAYNLSPDSALTAVMGSSMGGLMSIYMICEYPEVFGNAGCLSTHWPGHPAGGWPLEDAMVAYLNKNVPSPTDHKIYLDHGTEDIDSFYAPGETRVISLLKDKGYVEGQSLEYFVDEGAGHQERFWAKRVDRPLIFFFPIKHAINRNR